MHLQLVKAASVLVTTPLLALLLAGSCFAGAWTMPAGKLYERFAFTYYFADEQFGKGGGRSGFSSNGEYSEKNLSNYMEYGLTDRFTLINALYFKNAMKEDDSRDLHTSGIGDIDVGVKAKMFEGSWGVLSSQALAKIPGAYDEHEDLPLGNGQYDVELRLLYGRSLYPFIPGYYNVEIGYRWRFGDPADELRYLVEFGVDFTKVLYGRIKLDGICGMGNGRDFGSSRNPTAANNYDLGKLDMALGYKLTDSWGLEIGYTPEIYGRNVSAGATYTFAITYLLK